MSEINSSGELLIRLTDADWPRHLSTTREGDVLVADFASHRVLLFHSELRGERVLLDTNSQVQPWQPRRLHYNELTSQLYVVHNSSERRSQRDVISQWSLRWVKKHMKSSWARVTSPDPTAVCFE